MLRILRWMQTRFAKRMVSAAALSACLSASSWGADMSSPANPYPVGIPRAARSFSGTQSYGQAAYAQSYAPPSAKTKQLRVSQQYNQQQYLPPGANLPQSAGHNAAMAGTPVYMPLVPRVAPSARPASPYSFAGTPLASGAPRPLAVQPPPPAAEVKQATIISRDMTAKPQLRPIVPPPVAPNPSAASQLARVTPLQVAKPMPAAPPRNFVAPRPVVAPPPMLPMQAPAVAQASYVPPVAPPSFAPRYPQPAVYPMLPPPNPYGYNPHANSVASQFGSSIAQAPPRPRPSLSELAAFNQDLVPSIEEVPPAPGERDADADAGDQADDGTGAPRNFGGDTRADQIFGVAPESNELQFLRAQSVLLAPGERQIDIGFEYAITEGRPLVAFDAIPTLPPSTDEANIRLRNRLALIPMEIRYGVTDNVQAFCAVPFGWSNAELSFPGFDQFSNKVGIGDTNFGASILLCDGGGNAADVVATLVGTAPTGQADFPLLPTIPFSQLGEGYWAAAASILCIKTYDPVVVFYGLGYRHRFDATFDTIFGPQDVDPGEQIIYQFGVGFAANETVTLSCNYVGMYITESYVNDIRVQGGILEPMQLRFAITCAQECKIVEPFAVIGMTEDAPSARVGITWTY